jgi:hypothetical protein
LKLPSFAKDPAEILNLTNIPIVHGKHPRNIRGFAIRALAWGGGGAGRIPASRPRSRPGKRWSTTTCSPRAWGRPELGWRSCRSGRTAMAGGGGRGGSVRQREGLLDRQCASARATTGSRGDQKVVSRLSCAETGRARREGGNGGRRLSARPRGGPGAFYMPSGRPVMTAG